MPKPAAVVLALLVLCGCSADANRLTDLSKNWNKTGQDILTNFHNMYNPHVIYQQGEEYPYKMWFFGWITADCNPGYPGCDAVCFARSRDMDHWQVYSAGGTWDETMNPQLWEPVLYAGSQWYENYHIGDPSVVYKEGTYYMAYSATSLHFGPLEGYPAEMIQCVMGATSPDGIHWTSTPQPLLIAPEDTYPPNPSPGRIGDFHRPSLMWEDGRWRLWFDYWLPGIGTCMGYSENAGNFTAPGGFVVQHNLSQPLMEQWPNPDVVKLGNTYYCYADPGGFGQSGWCDRMIAEAVSLDGIHWTTTGHIPPEPDVATSHVPEAFVYEEDRCRKLVLFYACQELGDPSCSSGFDFRYKRIRRMWNKSFVFTRGDLNNDCVVDFTDFRILAENWQADGQY